MGERDPAEYTVEINGAECRVCLHYDCLKKVIGGFFSRPPLIYNVTQERADEMIKWGVPKWTSSSTTDCPPPDTTRVWCSSDFAGLPAEEGPPGVKIWRKGDDESNHTPWKDRVD